MERLQGSAEVLPGAEDSSFRWRADPEASLQLLRDLRRHGVKLYGTRWCLNCRQQKAMLYHICQQSGGKQGQLPHAHDRSHWKDMYVDCDLLLNSLETAYIKQVPAWKVGSQYHLGMQSEDTLRLLVDKVAGRKKAWKTGGHAQWQRRHKQRAAWAKQDYALLVREAIARGKQAAAADKATRRISARGSEMHPPQLMQHAALTQLAQGVTALRTSMERNGPRTMQHFFPGSAVASKEKAQTVPLQRFLQQHWPVLAGLGDRQLGNPVAFFQDRMREAQEARQLAPVGWFRERFTDADYGQLFETVAKIRLLTSPHVWALPRLLKPGFARASSAVEPAGFAVDRQQQQQQQQGAVERESEGGEERSPPQEPWAWVQQGRSVPGWDAPRRAGRAARGQAGSQRSWWGSFF